MTEYVLNTQAVGHARDLIAARRWVLDSQWSLVHPSAADENAYLQDNSWDGYGQWFLGLKVGAHEETKGRYGFVYGDFDRIHRSGLIACVDRAAEWHHQDVERAAQQLLRELDLTAETDPTT